MARFAAVRLSSDAPWEQERRIIGMVQSPLADSNVVLIKLETPVIYSDFVRPVCLAGDHQPWNTATSRCTTLGWQQNRPFYRVLSFVFFFHQVFTRSYHLFPPLTPTFLSLFYSVVFDPNNWFHRVFHALKFFCCFFCPPYHERFGFRLLLLTSLPSETRFLVSVSLSLRISLMTWRNLSVPISSMRTYSFSSLLQQLLNIKIISFVSHLFHQLEVDDSIRDLLCFSQ